MKTAFKGRSFRARFTIQLMTYLSAAAGAFTLSDLVLRGNRWHMLFSDLTMTALFLSGAVWLGRRSAFLWHAPLREIAKALTRAGDGRFGDKVRCETGDEMQALAQSFNAMTESLALKQQQLSMVNKSSRDLLLDFDQDRIVTSGLNSFRQLYPACRVTALLAQQGKLKVVRSEGGVRAVAMPPCTFSLGEGRLGILAQHAGVFVLDAARDSLPPQEAPLLQGSQHLLCVPLIWRDDVKGLIVIHDKADGADFSVKDIEFSEIIASSMAIALLNADLMQNTLQKARMESELETAKTVQKTLFPKGDPLLPEVEVSSFIESATETGGDWYGYLEDSKNRRLTILMGDATGHGVSAALMTAATNSVFKTLEIAHKSIDDLRQAVAQMAASGSGPVQKTVQALLQQTVQDPLSPSYLVGLLNKIVFQVTDGKMQMTFTAATLDLKTRVLTYANAGHEPPILYRHRSPKGSSSRFQFFNVTGPRLGERADAVFKETSVSLHSEDVLVFYTDGLVECANTQGEEFGARRLARRLERSENESAVQIRNSLFREARDFYGTTPRQDDVAFVVAKISKFTEGKTS